jgi:hypothetical protein
MNKFFRLLMWTSIGFLIILPISTAQAPKAEPPKATLVLEDQFERKQDIAQFRGNVLVILYGDKDGMPANKGLGEKLHVHYHPAAKGLPTGQAAKAPVAPLTGIPEGKPSPDVRVLPVACIGKVPDVVKGIIRSRVKKEAADSLVLLDFETKTKDQFGLKEGQPNLVIIDAQGRVRMKMSGEPDEKNYQQLIQAVDFLRKEAAGVK